MKTLMTVVYYRATWHTFKSKLEKIKKYPSQKNFLYLRKWNFLAPNKLNKKILCL